MGSSKTAAAKKASARPPRAEAEAASEVPVDTTPRTPLEAAPGSEVTQPEGQQPLTQPETETGLIEPQAGVTPPGDTNQPTDETTNLNPPPSDKEGADEAADVPMPPAREPDQGVIAEAATYATAPAAAGDAVATGYFLPAPPDLRTPPPKHKAK